MIRTDFVSNSSSSSFVLKTTKDMTDKSTYEQFLKYFSSGNVLDEYNVEEYENGIADRTVFSIFEFEFFTKYDEKQKVYDKYYNIPPMECLTDDEDNIDTIIENIFKDQNGGFESNGYFFLHEDFVFSHRGISVITPKSIEYTRKILKLIKDQKWQPELHKENCYVIKNHFDRYTDDKGDSHCKTLNVDEAETVLNKIEEDLKKGISYIVIAMTYSGDGMDAGKLWYEKDWDKEKSCYQEIKENNFGETFYIAW